MNALALKTIEFITQDSYEKLNEIGALYIENVSMTGTTRYIKEILHEVIDNFEDYINNYILSDESLEQKKYELSLSKIEIKKYLLKNQISDPSMLDMDFMFMIIRDFDTDLQQARLDHYTISENALLQIKEHQHIRHSHVKILYECISLGL